jgi:hypothetical protein
MEEGLETTFRKSPNSAEKASNNRFSDAPILPVQDNGAVVHRVAVFETIPYWAGKTRQIRLSGRSGRRSRVPSYDISH